MGDKKTINTKSKTTQTPAVHALISFPSFDMMSIFLTFSDTSPGGSVDLNLD